MSMTENTQNTGLLTLTEAARRVGRRPATVRKWMKRGHLRVAQVAGGPRRAHLFDPADVDDAAAGAAERTPEAKSPPYETR